MRCTCPTTAYATVAAVWCCSKVSESINTFFTHGCKVVSDSAVDDMYVRMFPLFFCKSPFTSTPLIALPTLRGWEGGGGLSLFLCQDFLHFAFVLRKVFSTFSGPQFSTKNDKTLLTPGIRELSNC